MLQLIYVNAVSRRIEMYIAKKFLYDILEIENTQIISKYLEDDYENTFDRFSYGVCISLEDGSISYSNKFFRDHLQSIAQSSDSDATTVLTKFLKSAIYTPNHFMLLESNNKKYLLGMNTIDSEKSDRIILTILCDLQILTNFFEQEDLEMLIKVLIKYRMDYMDNEFILDNLFDLLTVSDKNGTLVKVNSQIEKQFGIKKELAVGTSVNDLETNGVLSKSITKEVLKRESELKDTAEKGKPYSLVQDTKTGHRLLVTSTPLYGRNGELYKIFNISKDVTSMKELEVKLQEAEELIKEYETKVSSMENSQKIITSNLSMQHALNTVMQITTVDSTVLIEGETGVGKDVMARNIHDTSINKDGPFVKVNCGAIPDSLLESELFGYKKGAFTGALNQGKAGFVASAEGGTLFLDEIGDLPLNIQVKLLDLIQSKTYYPIGSVDPQTASIRIIAATHRDLAQMVKDGSFRQDLYYRLNVIPIYIPPLRERRSEIPRLTNEFLRKFCEKYNKNKHISREAMAIIINAPWPGNIRELENMIERMVVTSPSHIITPEDLPKQIQNDTSLENEADAIEIKINKIIPLKDAQQMVEKAMFEKAIELFPNKSVAADVLGIHRTTFSRKIHKPEK